MPGTAGRPLRPSDTCACRQGVLVDTAVLQTRARVARVPWWTPLDIGYGHESPGTAGRPLRPTDMDPSPLGQLLKTKGSRTKMQVAREGWLTPQALGAGPESPGTSVGIPVPREWSRVARETWSTQSALKTVPESPKTSGRPLRPSDPSVSPGTAGRNRWPSDPDWCRPGPLVDPGYPRSKCEFPGTAVQHRGT